MIERSPAYWKERLQLESHVEGGSYRRTYTSPAGVPILSSDGRVTGERFLSSSIYYLLEAGDFSALHRLKSDEMWHFYQGHPLHIYEIAVGGQLTVHQLGNDPDKGEVLQLVISAGSWFGSRVAHAGIYSLVGCTVTPAFDFQDFELGDRAELIASFPQHAALITSLTR